MAQLGGCSEEATVNDAVCTTVELTAGGGAVEVWSNASGYRVNGTILIENDGATGNPEAELTITGEDDEEPLLTVEPGESQSVTVNDISSITLTSAGTDVTGLSNVKVSFSLNYKY